MFKKNLIHYQRFSNINFVWSTIGRLLKHRCTKGHAILLFCSHWRQVMIFVHALKREGVTEYFLLDPRWEEGVDNTFMPQNIWGCSSYTDINTHYYTIVFKFYSRSDVSSITSTPINENQISKFVYRTYFKSLWKE